MQEIDYKAKHHLLDFINDNAVDKFNNKYSHLTNNQRAVLFAHNEGYKPAEIARCLKVEISTICDVFNRLKRKGVING